MNARRAALYARVSTVEQTPENQLVALRGFASARGWSLTEFVDHGVSGAKEKRPQLDALLADVRRRKFDLVVVTKLDRLARSTRHLVTLAGELEALGIDLVVLDQAIDTTTPSGRLLFHVLAAIAEFERDLIRDRVMAGLRRAKAQGRQLGRPRKHFISPSRRAPRSRRLEASAPPPVAWASPSSPSGGRWRCPKPLSPRPPQLRVRARPRTPGSGVSRTKWFVTRLDAPRLTAYLPGVHLSPGRRAVKVRAALIPAWRR